MPEYRIAIDPRNPGLFFACCGLFEIAELLAPGGIAGFEDGGRVFRLETEAQMPPARPELEPATAESEARYERTLEPLRLRCGERKLRLNWWLNATETDKSGLKTWGGQQTPRRMLQEVLDLLPECEWLGDVCGASVFATTRFGIDARSAWEPLDLGYSPNDTTRKAARTYPWVELLAVVGLQGFRPAGRGRELGYSVWLEPLPLGPARAACAAPWDGLPARAFAFDVMTRGQGYKTFAIAKGED